MKSNIGKMKAGTGEMITTVWILAMFLISMLATPLALADGADRADSSLAGVVYRGWSLSECKSVFGNYPYITNNLNAVVPPIEEIFKQYKGPLMKRVGTPAPETTGCYCGAANGQHYVMNEDKTKCVLCKGRTLDPNAVYYTDENAEAEAVLRVGGVDIGCRCAKKSGDQDFLRIENGRCIYGKTSQQDTICQQRFGKEGVKVCSPNAQAETPLGSIASGGVNIDCCCTADYKKVQTAETLGGYKCVKEAGAQDSACAQWGKQEGRGELMECPEEFRGTDVSKLTDAQKEERARRRVGPIPGATKPDGSPIVCCCKSDSALINGVCVKDECGSIVPNSVLSARSDADPNYPVRAGVGAVSSMPDKEWNPSLIRQLQQKNLQCSCRKGSVPKAQEGGNPNILVKCDMLPTMTGCPGIIPGSVPLTAQNADNDQRISRDSIDWEAYIRDALRDANLDCACARGTTGKDINSNGLKDVCAVENPACINSEELAALMKVGMCTSKDQKEELSLKLDEISMADKGPVIFVGSRQVSVKDKPIDEWHVIGALGYGISRALGARALYYLTIGARGCSSKEPGDDYKFHEFIDYTKCIAGYPCNEMPVSGLAHVLRISSVAGAVAGVKSTSIAKITKDLESKLRLLSASNTGTARSLGKQAATRAYRIAGLDGVKRVQNVLWKLGETRTIADDIMKAAGEAAKSVGTKFVKVSRLSTRMGKLAGFLGRTGRWLGRGMNWVGRKILVPYMVIDAISSAAFSAFSKDLEINPGSYTVAKASVKTPFSINPGVSSGERVPAIKTITFNVGGNWASGAPSLLLGGGIFDVQGTDDVTKPPDGIEGKVYKCVGSCTCKENVLNNCYCFEVPGSINEFIDTSSAPASSFIFP